MIEVVYVPVGSICGEYRDDLAKKLNNGYSVIRADSYNQGLIYIIEKKDNVLSKEEIDPIKYLIVEHGFDSMENHNPGYKEIVGVVSSKIKAEEIINRLDNNTEKYKGWDGKLYPQFKIEEINSLDKEE